MTHLDGLCNHDKILTGACLDCAEEHCVHHGKHPKGACPICAGLDVYAPALYNADMDNLIERLRDPYGLHYPRCREAADEIERLTADLNRHIEHEQAQANRIGRFKERIAKLERALKSIVGQTDDQMLDGVWREVNTTALAAIADMEQT